MAVRTSIRSDGHALRRCSRSAHRWGASASGAASFDSSPTGSAARDAARELEELGYGALFIPDVGGDVLGAVDELLTATSRIVVATGIINIWMHDAAAIAAGVSRLDGEERMLAGLGVGHAANVDVGAPGRYVRPLSKLRGYLDELDEARPPLPAPNRILAALGPRMLELSRDRAGGAHPYLVPSEHTARAREILGPDRLLAPEQGVVLTDDPARGREIARTHVSDYLRLPNYVANLRRLGFGDEDLAGDGQRTARRCAGRLRRRAADRRADRRAPAGRC